MKTTSTEYGKKVNKVSHKASGDTAGWLKEMSGCYFSANPKPQKLNQQVKSMLSETVLTTCFYLYIFFLFW